MRRVGRLQTQLCRGLVRHQPFLDDPGAVHPAIVDHQQNPPVCLLSDLLEELPEDLRRDRAFPHPALELALRAAGRQQVQAETPAGHPHDGGLTARAPGAPGPALRSQAGLVGARRAGLPTPGRGEGSWGTLRLATAARRRARTGWRAAGTAAAGVRATSGSGAPGRRSGRCRTFPQGLAHSLRGPPSELEWVLSGILVSDDDADPSQVPVCP